MIIYEVSPEFALENRMTIAQNDRELIEVIKKSLDLSPTGKVTIQLRNYQDIK